MSLNIFQNPAFQNLSPEKLQFLMEFQQMAKPSSMKDAAPFFMQSLKQAQEKGNCTNHQQRTAEGQRASCERQDQAQDDQYNTTGHGPDRYRAPQGFVGVQHVNCSSPIGERA